MNREQLAYILRAASTVASDDEIIVVGRQSILARFDAEPATARCLEPHDLVVAKLVAGREKDYRFVAALLAAGLISADLLVERAGMLETVGAVQQRVSRRIGRLVDGTPG